MTKILFPRPLTKDDVDLTHKDSQGMTGLHWGARMGAVDASENLLEWGADPNAVDNNGQTPLHWAVKNNHLKLCELLLKYKADTEIVDKFGYKAIHYAVNPEIRKMLVKN